MVRLIDAASASKKRSAIIGTAAKALWKNKRENPDEWGANNRVYPAGSGVPGERDPGLTPYNIPFCRAFGDARYRRVVLVEAAQCGKTEGFLDIIGERLDNRPAPALYVGPSKEFVTDQFEPRLVEMFRQSKTLLPKVLGGIDGKKQKKTLKRVAGTRLRLAHAGSSTALKSDQASYALVDEYDEMLRNVKGQGDPLGLVEARGDTYADFVAGITSTPSHGMVETEFDEASGLEFWKVADTEDVTSPIWRLFQEGTRHHWCWPCPHCGHYFVPRFSCLSWPKEATPAQARRQAFVQCPRADCGGVIEEHHKAAMNARGVFVAPGQVVDIDGNVTGDPPDTSTLSFWVSGLASPFVTFGQRVEVYLTAFRSRESAKIQTAINSQFGEVYVDGAGDVPEWLEIQRRIKPFVKGVVPDAAVFLTSGIDVQKSRLVYVVRAWGARATSWLVDYGELHGASDQIDVWHRLTDLLTSPIDGRLIKLAFVDSGFRPGKKFLVPTNRVYDFCRKHRRFVFPTKGSSRPLNRPLVQSKIEVTQQGTAAKYGLDLIRLDTDHWKSWVHERLAWPTDQAGAWLLPEGITKDYCQQIVAEARVISPSGKPQWIMRSRENHFLDAEAMAAAAGFLLNVHHLRDGAKRPTRAPASAPPPAQAAAAATAAAANTTKFSRFADLAQKLNR